MKRGWKIVLGAAILAAILAVLLWSLKPPRQILVYSPPLCGIKTERAVEIMLREDFPRSWRSLLSPAVAEIIAINDSRCEDNFGKANFAIILENDGRVRFGIFNIYFSFKQELIESRTIVPWKEFPDRNDPRIDALWRNFIKTVYPEEMNPTHN